MDVKSLGARALNIGAPNIGALNMGAGGWTEAPAAAGAADWLAARRHSRAVSVLRLVLPAVALVVVVWMFVSARSLPTEIGDIDLGEVGLEGTTLTMQNPSLSGFNDNGTSYQVTAAKAMQDVTNPRVVTLESIDGTMTKPDGDKVRVTADHGVLDSDSQVLDLTSNIVVKTDKDDYAYLNAAKVDMAAGSIVTSEPVRAVSKSGKIRAKSMEITDRGAHLLFRGNVVVDLRLDGGRVDDAGDAGNDDSLGADSLGDDSLGDGAPGVDGTTDGMPAHAE